MKAKLALVIGSLFLFGIAQANILVTQNGKTIQYKNGSTVKVNAPRETTVNYNNVKVTVPAGITVEISQAKNGNVIVKGKNLSNVKIGDISVASDGEAVFTVNAKTADITVNKGTLYVKDADGQFKSVKQGDSFGTRANTAAANTPAFVNEAVFNENTASQQAVGNVIEEEVLSPSSPR